MERQATCNASGILGETYEPLDLASQVWREVREAADDEGQLPCKVRINAPDRRGPGQDCAQQVALAHVAFGQRVVSKHLHRERKKHRQPDVLPDQQTQVFNGQSPDR